MNSLPEIDFVTVKVYNDETDEVLDEFDIEEGADYDVETYVEDLDPRMADEDYIELINILNAHKALSLQFYNGEHYLYTVK